ncbi:hypothetical protein JQ615_41030 [Bradyrhizobium jicamae]|uniref:ArsR family transcriptional regulator n=1 Tax=Bradyrhizobium jicamae TaxID=280332 RepID=A0ABS5FYT3_9BRAD|nr:hypothetical protein [Bradyrhizobium jicamae]MBR0801729.1 hypothetical protein [Bradyrhizobium jicamae]
MVENDEARQKSWTSQKLEWLNRVSVDPRVKPGTFEVGFCIIQHANAGTGIAILSDRTISDKTGISSAEVYRHRQALKELGWITWTRGRHGLRIKPLFSRMNLMLDYLMHLREVRNVERLDAPLKRKNKSSPAMDLRATK